MALQQAKIEQIITQLKPQITIWLAERGLDQSFTQRIDRFMMWSFGFTITVAGMVITVLKVWH
ncbi:MAG: hypothetical protein HQL99_08885 [Magnetococcales bacterium]|nr:hypothetical protein [Magnetococcales bacterium]